MRVVFVLLAALAALPAIAQTESDHAGEAKIEPYEFRTFDGVAHKAELGHLWVKENRRRDASRLIELAFVRLKTAAVSPRSPVVFVPGGPGIPAIGMGRVPVYYSLFEKLLAKSDVILLDQRGIGISEPNTQCPAGDAPAADVLATEANIRSALRAMAVSCAKAWRAKGADLEGYSTAESADDLDDLRMALGAKKLSLVAHSYGTTLALEAVRRHGEHIDRVVLSGVEGTDRAVQMPLVFDFGLQRLAEIAAVPGKTRGMFLDTYGEFRQVVEQLDREPLTVRVHDEKTKQDVDVKVGGFFVRFVVRSMLPNGRQAGRILALVETLAHRDATLLTAAAQDFYNTLEGGFTAMQNAIYCTDGWSDERMRLAEREAAKSTFGDAPFVQLDAQTCREMGIAKREDDSLLPFWSDVPALFVSGTLDANTPGFGAEEVAWRFARGETLTVENGFHETLPADEVQTIVADYLAGAEVKQRVIAFAPPQFLTVEEAKASPQAEH